MKPIYIYRFGQTLSITLWVLVAWSLTTSEPTTFQLLIRWVGLGTIIIHAFEVSGFFIVKRLKPHFNLRNVLLTFIFGGFQLKWLLDKA